MTWVIYSESYISHFTCGEEEFLELTYEKIKELGKMLAFYKWNEEPAHYTLNFGLINLYMFILVRDETFEVDPVMWRSWFFHPFWFVIDTSDTGVWNICIYEHGY